VFRYIYRYDKAVDITNDGFVRLFLHFDRFVPGSIEDTEKMLMAYIRKIMVNAAIDELRKQRMAPEIGGIPEYVWDFSSKEQDADQMVLYKEIVIMVKALPPQYRIVFNMYVIDGYNHIEIADALGIPQGTSKSHLSRARAILQKEIKKSENSALCSI
jgi:RNA polymerase sigma-70 factor (ECF subfamily)